jgi:hypothetical protein
MAKNKKNARREAMRLVAYIRTAGVEPIPFNHRDFQAYRADIQRQYQTLRSSMDEEAGRQARLAGRALVRLKTLDGAAGDVVPINVSPGRKHQRTAQAPTPSISVAPRPDPTLRDLQNCRRKLRHLNFLSALHHAKRLGDPDLHVYPCPICSGLHVGHNPDRMQLRDLGRELAAIESRMATLKLEEHKLRQSKAALLQVQELLHKTQEASGDHLSGHTGHRPVSVSPANIP